MTSSLAKIKIPWDQAPVWDLGEAAVVMYQVLLYYRGWTVKTRAGMLVRPHRR